MARQSWLDDDAQTTLIDDYARNLTSFVDAMADGIVDANEVAGQDEVPGLTPCGAFVGW